MKKEAYLKCNYSDGPFPDERVIVFNSKDENRQSLQIALKNGGGCPQNGMEYCYMLKENVLLYIDKNNKYNGLVKLEYLEINKKENSAFITFRDIEYLRKFTVPLEDIITEN